MIFGCFSGMAIAFLYALKTLQVNNRVWLGVYEVYIKNPIDLMGL
jgi:hypothetical protein